MHSQRWKLCLGFARAFLAIASATWHASYALASSRFVSLSVAPLENKNGTNKQNVLPVCLRLAVACLFYLNALFAEAISCVPSWRWSRTSTMIQRAQKDRCMKLLTLTHTLSLTSLPHLSRYSLMCSQMCAVSNFHRFLCFLRALAVEVLVD